VRLDEQRLHDILEAIEAINRYAILGKEEFERNELIQVWCIRHLEIIGESATKLSEEIRNKTLHLPWRQMIGMRNILIHGYFDVNTNQVWNVVANELEKLRVEILKLLNGNY